MELCYIKQKLKFSLFFFFSSAFLCSFLSLADFCVYVHASAKFSHLFCAIFLWLFFCFFSLLVAVIERMEWERQWERKREKNFNETQLSFDTILALVSMMRIHSLIIYIKYSSDSKIDRIIPNEQNMMNFFACYICVCFYMNDIYVGVVLFALFLSVN